MIGARQVGKTTLLTTLVQNQNIAISSNELIQTFGLVEEQKLLENRLIYGSYPEIINHPELAKQTLNELTQSYLYKDILSLGNIRKPQVVEKLLQALAFQVGSEVSVNELSRLLPVDNKTIDSYIDLLEKCYEMENSIIITPDNYLDWVL